MYENMAALSILLPIAVGFLCRKKLPLFCGIIWLQRLIWCVHEAWSYGLQFLMADPRAMLALSFYFWMVFEVVLTLACIYATSGYQKIGKFAAFYTIFNSLMLTLNLFVGISATAPCQAVSAATAGLLVLMVIFKSYQAHLKPDLSMEMPVRILYGSLVLYYVPALLSVVGVIFDTGLPGSTIFRSLTSTVNLSLNSLLAFAFCLQYRKQLPSGLARPTLRQAGPGQIHEHNIWSR